MSAPAPTPELQDDDLRLSRVKLIMDEEESEQASVPATPQKLSSDDVAVVNSSKELSTTLDTNAERRKENTVAKDCRTTKSGQTHPAPVADATSQKTEHLEISASQPELGFAVSFGE
ncbi:hypothetical protein MTO96_022087 [Rhipicephalus appendiculatus]